MSTTTIADPSLKLLPPTTSPPSRLIGIRRARFNELPVMARLSSLAFWDDVLFGRLIHPHRNRYPADFDKYWLKRFWHEWFQWDHVLLVAVEEIDDDSERGTGKKEVITGQAVWGRIASRKENWQSGWDLAWWDPRRLLSPLFTFFTRIYFSLRPNRAADPRHESIIDASDPFLDHIWTGPVRSRSWLLEYLAVHPDYQNCGVGRKLVAWGLDRAKEEGISASVIAAQGKEKFYQRCGFDTGPVGRAGEGGEKNPLSEVPGGLIFFWDGDGVEKGDEDVV